MKKEQVRSGQLVEFKSTEIVLIKKWNSVDFYPILLRAQSYKPQILDKTWLSEHNLYWLLEKRALYYKSILKINLSDLWKQESSEHELPKSEDFF